jgi:hypothetical protein
VCQADVGWPLRISVVVCIGEPVAEVLGVWVRCTGAFIFLALGRHAGLAHAFRRLPHVAPAGAVG